MLETARLLFRPHEPRDLDPFCAMEMDARMRRFTGGAPRTRAEAERRFAAMCARFDPRLPFCAAIYKPEQRYVGRCGLHPAEGGGAALGFHFAPAWWGRGLATEAARAFVDYAFGELRLPRISAAVEAGNTPSVRVLEKCGFGLARRESGGRRSFEHYELRA